MSSESRPAPARAERPSILVCDDDPVVRDVVGAMLEGHGYRVIPAGSGPEAVRRAVRERPAAIVLDLLMPRVSGWETVAALKERAETERIPIVVLSVLTDDYSRETAPAATEWLHKPVERSALVGALEHAMATSERPARVLVVEDDLDLAPLMTTMVERQGAEAFHVATGEAAIELWESVEPDLLILDLALPEMDGFAVVDWLRGQQPARQVPIVIFTSRELDAADRERLRQGDVQVLSKGRVGPGELEQRVIGLLDGITCRRGPAGGPSPS